MTTVAAALIVLGGLAQMYVTIIGGQAWPLDLFPGYEMRSSFYDGVIHPYAPSLPEAALALGGFAIALAGVLLGVKFLRLLPESLSDEALEPGARRALSALASAMAHVFISAAHKSSGKTTLTLGLAAALARRGLAVQPFKKGPDYIDPMWLSLAAGRPCRNLDFHLMTRDEIGASFARHARAADVSLIEGNKGLYDGLDLQGSNSNAALAALLGSPVVLVIDARGMTRGIAPLILGYQAFDPSIRIAGVILNNLGGARHEQKLRAVIAHYTGVEVIGAVPHDERIAIVERHLGLVPSNEAVAAAGVVEAVRERVEQSVDLERLLAIAASAAPLPELAARGAPRGGTRLRVGIARDAAFGFYYADDLEALAEAGAELMSDRHAARRSGCRKSTRW